VQIHQSGDPALSAAVEALTVEIVAKGPS
jgi:hypothetical protein